MLLRLFIFFLVFGCLPGSGMLYAQEDYGYELYPREQYYQSRPQEHQFSKAHWVEVTEGIDYSEAVRRERQEDENFFTSNENRQRNNRYDDFQAKPSAFWALLFKFLIIGIGIAIIGLIIARFLGPEGLGKPRSRRIEQQQMAINLENIEENIHESDLEKFIRQALEQQDFNLAIRLYYLAIIKELSLSKAIRWKRDKTNRDYMRELSGRAFVPEFRQLTAIFERCWYGNHRLSEANFNALRPRFEQMIQAAQQAVDSTSLSKIEAAAL